MSLRLQIGVWMQLNTVNIQIPRLLMRILWKLWKKICLFCSYYTAYWTYIGLHHIRIRRIGTWGILSFEEDPSKKSPFGMLIELVSNIFESLNRIKNVSPVKRKKHERNCWKSKALIFVMYRIFWMKRITIFCSKLLNYVSHFNQMFTLPIPLTHI